MMLKINFKIKKINKNLNYLKIGLNFLLRLKNKNKIKFPPHKKNKIMKIKINNKLKIKKTLYRKIQNLTIL